MGNFKDFVYRDDATLADIMEILQDMDAESLDVLGFYLFSNFFDDSDEEDYEEDAAEFFAFDDVVEMIQAMGQESYPAILDLIMTEYDWDDSEDFNDDGTIETEEIYESVTRRMLSSNRNRKKRKFMAKSVAELRKTAAARKRHNRQTRQSRKRYYRANKQKIAAYQASRNAAIAAGKHIPKKRRKSG